MLWMQTRLLDAARAALGADATDYRLCKTLGISTAYMSQLRKGNAIVSQSMALRLAVLARVPPEEVLPAIEMERAARDVGDDDGALLGTWQRIAKRLSGKAAALALTLGTAALGGAPAPSQAATGGPGAGPGLYIMANRRRTGPGLAPA